MTFRWSSRSARYHDSDTGRFISTRTVRKNVRLSIESSQSFVRDLARLVSDGSISSREWRSEMRSEIKREYIRQYSLGRGGIAQMTQADWGSIGGMLREQYRYLDNFADQVDGLTEAQIAVRAAMYSSSSREGFERGFGRSNREAGKTQERWVLGNAEHCDDCVANASEGWQEIGYFGNPGDGQTRCLTNCKCHKEYR